MAQVAANGITIEYEQHGTGDPLLLVQGLNGQLSDWPPELVELLVDAGFQVTVFDNREIGLSSEMDWEPPKATRSFVGALSGRGPEVLYTLHDMAADAAALLDALHIEAAHVAGVSMGGMISQQLTIDHPDRVRSLTSIMSAPGDGKSGRPSAKVMAKMARRPVATPETAPDMSVEYFQMWSGPHFDPVVHRERVRISVDRSFRPRASQKQMAAIMASPDRTPGLRDVTVPTLVIHGLHDRLIKPSGGVATAAAVPNSRLVMYPDMGHDLPAPRLAEMVEEIRRNADRSGAGEPGRKGTTAS